MPRRTNEFQKLVYLIEKALSPRASITESALVDVPGLKTPREIDVLIEDKRGPYRVKIAVEAKGEGKRIGLPTFESIMGKYRGEGRVPVDKIVIVSHRGFTKGVIEKARLAQVELLTLAEAQNRDWSQLGPKMVQFTVAPHICRIQVVPQIESASQEDIRREGRLICPHGKDCGTLNQFAHHAVFHRLLPSRPELAEEFERTARQSGGQAMATVTVPLEKHTVHFRGRQYAIRQIKIGVHYVSATGELSCTSYERTSSTGRRDVVRHAEAILAGKALTFVLPHQDFAKNMVLHIASAPTRIPKRKMKTGQAVNRTIQRPIDVETYGKKLQELCLSEKAIDAVQEQIANRHKPSTRKR